MKNINPKLEFLFDMAKVQSMLNRKFDGNLGGLGFTEFIILYHLSISPDQKLKRIDLANKVGFTASGITRILLPMEKIGLISKETNPTDARVSLVILASGGKRVFEEALEGAELLADDIISEDKADKVKSFSELLKDISSKI